MRSKKRIIITSLVCIGIAALAYFAWLFPFYVFETNDFDTSIEKLLSFDYLKTLVPLFIIIGLSAVGIILIVLLRRMLAKSDRKYSRFADDRIGRARGKAPKQKPAVFMIIRWVVMIASAFLLIWGGLIFGMGISSLSIPVLSCPWNTEEMANSSCYYLSHLNELFELPIGSILLFFYKYIGIYFCIGSGDMRHS